VLDQLAMSMKRHSSLARRAWAMLWVTMTMVYFSRSAPDQLFDFAGALGIES